jgi:hypothetical protein
MLPKRNGTGLAIGDRAVVDTEQNQFIANHGIAINAPGSCWLIMLSNHIEQPRGVGLAAHAKAIIILVGNHFVLPDSCIMRLCVIDGRSPGPAMSIVMASSAERTWSTSSPGAASSSQ